MKKLLVSAVAAGLAMVSATSAAATREGGFFVNAGVGQAQYRLGSMNSPGLSVDNKDAAGAVRFGYYWRGPINFGIETGYVYLGKRVLRYQLGDYSLHEDLKATGLLLGLNSTYHFESPWYISARGGVLHSGIHGTYSYKNLPYGPTHGSSGYGSSNGTGTGWYAGIGGGYDLSSNLSIGVHYDNYHVKANENGHTLAVNVSAFTLQFEYRF